MQRKLSQIGELSGAFVVRDPRWREKIFFGGLLLLLIHPVGWPVALGYRKELISRLSSGAEPLLPEWQGNIPRYFLEGLKAMGVIFGYLFPLYITLLVILLSNGVTPNLTWMYGVLFFVLCTIFSTLSFPVTLYYWTFVSESYRLPHTHFFAFATIFTLVVFFIPSAFLQVSKSGKYLSAFNLTAAYSTLRLNFRSYLLAWYRSSLMSLSGHFALPFAPWGVFWCYLGIIFEFNSILDEDLGARSAGSWYQRIQGQDAILVETTSKSHILKCLNPSDAHQSECLFFKLGPILIPLPRALANFINPEA